MPYLVIGNERPRSTDASYARSQVDVLSSSASERERWDQLDSLLLPSREGSLRPKTRKDNESDAYPSPHSAGTTAAILPAVKRASLQSNYSVLDKLETTTLSRSRDLDNKENMYGTLHVAKQRSSGDSAMSPRLSRPVSYVSVAPSVLSLSSNSEHHSARQVRPLSAIQQPQTGPLGSSSRHSSSSSRRPSTTARHSSSNISARPRASANLPTGVTLSHSSKAPANISLLSARSYLKESQTEESNEGSSTPKAVSSTTPSLASVQPLNLTKQVAEPDTSLDGPAQTRTQEPATTPGHIKETEQAKKTAKACLYSNPDVSASSSSIAASFLKLRRSSTRIVPSSDAATDRGYDPRKSFLGMHTPSFRSRQEPLSTRKSMSDIKRSIASITTSSLFRSSASTERTFDRSMISLPTPADDSCEKLRNKLKGSPSILSLTPGRLGEATGMPEEEYQATMKRNLLKLCHQRRIHSLSSLAEKGPLVLISQGLNGILLRPSQQVKQPETYQLVPYGGYDQIPIHAIVQEMKISKMVMPVDGFAQIANSWLAEGLYSSLPVPTGIQTSKHGYGTRSINVDEHDVQHYFVKQLSHTGDDLEHFPFSNWAEVTELFWQIARSLAVAEKRFQFEHRDLTWNNIIVERQLTGLVTGYINNCTLSRATDLSDGSTIYTRLDHPSFFRGKGDYQYEVYHMMQKLLAERSVDKTDPDWSLFEPRTNVLWLHYLAKKLLTGTSLAQSRAVTPAGQRGYSDHLHKTLDHVEQALNPSRRRFRPGAGTFKDFRCAGDVVTWGVRHSLCNAI